MLDATKAVNRAGAPAITTIAAMIGQRTINKTISGKR
jgi:hypothetical protein